MIQSIILPPELREVSLPHEISINLSMWLLRIQAFQDRWDRPDIEQFVAADYEHVYQVLKWTLESQLTIGNRFLEWGCGFAVVSALAATFNLDVIGIEAVDDLIAEGRKTIADAGVDAELVHGNFLPRDSETLADDPTLPSLGHGGVNAYEQIGLQLDDFAIVYAYPWPGEDKFHRDVFDQYAARGALLILFCGPNDIRVSRKTS